MTDDLRRVCAKVGICVKLSSPALPLLGILQSNGWTRDLAQRQLSREMLGTWFDNYLKKMHGYSPLTAAQDLQREFAGTVGYFRNPEWQFPALREFLPIQRATIGADGIIEIGGLKYRDDLLAYFPGRSVTIRKTVAPEQSIWVYLDNEILCQAVILNRSLRDLIVKPQPISPLPYGEDSTAEQRFIEMLEQTMD
jgi:Mu transposase, C-terminal